MDYTKYHMEFEWINQYDMYLTLNKSGAILYSEKERKLDPILKGIQSSQSKPNKRRNPK